MEIDSNISDSPNDSLEPKKKKPKISETVEIPVSDSKTIRPAITLNIYDDGFGIDDQRDAFYSYDNTTKAFVRAIDLQKLPPDLVDLFDDVPNIYHNGAMTVKMKDFRDNKTSTPKLTNSLLKPTIQTIINDVNQITSKLHKRLTMDDQLLIEQKILQHTAPPICLDPSVQVAVVANEAYYNKNKFNIKPAYPESLEEEQEEKKQEELKGVRKSALFNYLKDNYAKHKPSILVATQDDSYSLMVHQIVNRTINNQNRDVKPDLTSPVMGNSLMLQLYNRRLRFIGNQGRTFCYFQVIFKRPGGYEGVLRVGKMPDSGHNGDVIRFPLGNAESASAFVSQLKLIFEREGIGAVVFDSSDPNSRDIVQPSLSSNINLSQAAMATAVPPGASYLPIGLNSSHPNINVNNAGGTYLASQIAHHSVAHQGLTLGHLNAVGSYPISVPNQGGTVQSTSPANANAPPPRKVPGTKGRKPKPKANREDA